MKKDGRGGGMGGLYEGGGVGATKTEGSGGGMQR